MNGGRKHHKNKHINIERAKERTKDRRNYVNKKDGENERRKEKERHTHIIKKEKHRKTDTKKQRTIEIHKKNKNERRKEGQTQQQNTKTDRTND